MICHSDLGKSLRVAQSRAGMSNVKLADQLKITKQEASRIRYLKDMKFSKVKELAALFELSVDEFDSLGR